MHTAATLFSGGGGADIGLSGAGFDVQWGLEHDEEIAQVARDNGLNIHTADVTEVDPSWYERVDVLHASPPCPNFSVAKTGGEETDEDVSLAEATVRFADEIEPQLFTLENVWGYRKSRSWKLIREHLQRSGYDWNAWKINAANYGIPQTRKRMIVAARRGGPRPKKPPATHAENPSSGGLFGSDLNEWVGWYEAIEDLIPDLPETELADWQKERLPDDLLDTELVHGTSTMERRSASTPSASVVATVVRKAAAPRAVICDTQPKARGDNREGQEPTKTVAADPAGGAPRAVLVQGMTSSNGEELVTRDGEAPMWTEGASEYKRAARAVLVGDNTNTTSNSKIHREADEPCLTVRKSSGGNNLKGVTRRVVQMTPRALARFQTFPDEYELPDSKSLACRIIGNAVPPLLMKKCISHWIN
jgi:DNA (cytosine-5)-methyltransferase 1